MAGYYKVTEGTVPRRFRRREGDWAQEGGNNTLIVMGTDRAVAGGGPATVDDGLGTKDSVADGKRTGVVHLVAGRVDGFGNTDLVADDAYLYIASATDLDENLDLQGVGQGTQWPDAKDTEAGILRSRNIRIVYRNDGDVRILSDGGQSFLVMNDNYVDVYVAKNIWMQAGETKMEVRDETNDGVVRLGPLAASLADLIQRMSVVLGNAGLTVGPGNLMAPVPSAGTFQSEMNMTLLEWQNTWLTGDYIRKE